MVGPATAGTVLPRSGSERRMTVLPALDLRRALESLARTTELSGRSTAATAPIQRDMNALAIDWHGYATAGGRSAMASVRESRRQ
jgi:hypothetical protein